MAVKIRLARHGAKKRPYYRIVVADSRMPRDGRFIEQVGRYDPIPDPHLIQIDLDKVDEWISKGAEPTNAVAHLIDIVRTDAPAPEPAVVVEEPAPETPEGEEPRAEAVAGE